jgi:hypothetical protein
VAGKQQLHEAVERLPESQIPAALSYLEFLSTRPAWPSLADAPLDDEPQTEAERLAVEEARRDPRPDLSHERVRREPGVV